MSSKRAPERIEELRQRLLDGMAEKGHPAGRRRGHLRQDLAFSSYGFPESHAISFAYLVYTPRALAEVLLPGRVHRRPAA